MLRSLFKHSGIYFIGLLGGRVLTTLTWIILARTMDKPVTGQAVLYLTLLEITTFIADFGLNQWYLKHVDGEDRNKLFQKVISARLFTLALSLCIMSVILTVTKTFPPDISLIFIVSLIPRAILSIGDGYFLEKKQSFRLALKTILYMSMFLLGFLLLRTSINFYRLVVVYLVSMTVTAIWYFPWRALSDMRFLPLSKVQTILVSSSSYALLVITSFIYARGDSIIVGYAAGNAALASYGIAYRYLEGVSLFPTAIMQNLFPISAKKEGIPFGVLKKMTLVLTLFGIIVGLILFVLSDVLTTILLGPQYADASAVVKIFGLVACLFFINAPIATVVQSSNYVRKFLPWGIANTVANVVLNLLLVPTGGIEAAAWVMLTTEVTGLFVNVFFLKKIYKL